MAVADHRDQDPPVAYYPLKDVATYLSRSRSLEASSVWPLSGMTNYRNGPTTELYSTTTDGKGYFAECGMRKVVNG